MFSRIALSFVFCCLVANVFAVSTAPINLGDIDNPTSIIVNIYSNPHSDDVLFTEEVDIAYFTDFGNVIPELIAYLATRVESGEYYFSVSVGKEHLATREAIYISPERAERLSRDIPTPEDSDDTISDIAEPMDAMEDPYQLEIGDASHEALYISSQRVGIRVTDPAVELHIDGKARSDATMATDHDQTLTTKDYVDGLVGGALPADNVTGTGVAPRVAFWDGANTLTSDADFRWDNDTLKVNGMKMYSSGLFNYIDGATELALMANTISITLLEDNWIQHNAVASEFFGNVFVRDTIGIGLSTPPTKRFEVNGTAGYRNVTDMGSTDTDFAHKQYVDDLVGGGIPTGAANQTLRHNGTSWVANNTLANDGTTLTVSGNVVATNVGSASSFPFRILQTWNNSSVFFQGLLVNITDNNSAASARLLDIQRNSTSHFAVHKSGSVGIGLGASIPAHTLDVSGDARFTGQVIIPVTPTANAHAASKQYVDGLITGVTESNWTQSGSNLYPNSTAWNVGIGTNSPDVPLDIQSTSGATGLRIRSHNAAVGSQAILGFRMTTSASGGDYAQIRGIRTNVPASTGSDLAFYTSDGSGPNEHMRIKSEGNVGIGTVSPEYPLDVRGNGIGVHDGTNFTNVNSSNIRFNSASYSIGHGSSYGGLVSDMNEIITMLSSGSVGIGTNPEAFVDIYQGSASSMDGLRIIKVSDINQSALTVQHNTGVSTRTIADFRNNSGTQVLIRGDGNVGIGTGSPSTQLHTTGGVRFQTLGGSGTRMVVTDNSGNLSHQAIPGGGVSGTGAANKVAFWTGASTLSNNTNFHWDNTNTRLGVGTGAPAHTLHVVGSTVSIGGSNTVGSGTSSNNIAIGHNIVLTGGSAAWRTQVGIGYGARVTSDRACVAIGYGAATSQDYSNILGTNSAITGSGTGSHVVGVQCTVSVGDGFAFGHTSVVTGSNGYAIGRNCPAEATGAMALGRYITNSISNSTAIGVSGTAIFVNSSNLVGIGTTAPSTQLHTTGGVRFSGAGTPAAGRVLTSDALGNATWQAPTTGTVTSIGTGTGITGGTITTSGTVTLQNIRAGMTSQGALWYNGTTQSAGRLYGGSTNPSNTTRLNYSGYFYATHLYDGGNRVYSASYPPPSSGGSNWTLSGSNVYRSSGNVGIGTTSPAAPLDVRASGGIQVTNPSSTSNHLTIQTPGTWHLMSTTNNFSIRAGGSLTFQTGGANTRMNISAAGVITMPSMTGTSIRYSTVIINTGDGRLWYAASSKRYKRNIVDMDSVDWLYNLRPVYYVAINDSSEEIQYGLIAEEVENVNPLLVFHKDGEVEGVYYNDLVTPMLKALQEQKSIIEKQQAEIDRLKALEDEIDRLKAFEARLEALESR